MKTNLLLLALLTGVSLTSSGCLLAAGAIIQASRPPPINPVVNALDTNHDGVIDAAEISNAPAALKTLDKNHDGRLTTDETKVHR